MKCAVIGSEGYIGRHLVYFLKEMGADVFCYDLNISSSHQQYKRLDVTDPISLRDLNLDVDYLFVFSGITGTSVGFEEYERFVQVNEIGLLNILTLIRKSVFMPHVVYPSTRLVYKGMDLPLKEEDPLEGGALKQVHEAVEQTGPDSVWLKNHDAYIASQLRAACKAGESTARYSVQDLTAAGQIAQDYRAEIDGASSCGRNEVTLGLNLAIADMKAETMISKGLVSDSMAALLRSSRTQGHENALSALDQALSTRESSRASGEPKGTYAPVDSTVFRGIYDAVMSAYRQNGGDAAKAIQAGASAGEKLTAQAAARAPKAARWGVSMKHYLQEFYKAPEEQAVTLLGLHIKYLTNQKPRTSTYQKYVNSWQDFLTSIGGGVNIRA